MSGPVKTSLARLIANRRNAKKSRGPRTAGGKSRASADAIRHGLAAPMHRDPHFFPQVERIAQAICNDDKDPLLMEQALVIAENHLILESVRTQSIAMIERLRDGSVTPLSRDNSLERAKLKLRLAKLEYTRRLDAKQRQKTKGPDKEKAKEPDKTASTKADFKAITLAMDGLKAMAANQARRRRKAGNPPEARSQTAPGTTNGAEVGGAAAERNEFDAMCLALPDLRRRDRYARRAWSRRMRAIDRFIAIKARSGAGPSTNE